MPIRSSESELPQRLPYGTDMCATAPAAQKNQLGFPKPPSKTRVVVAMSGGVDSSVVAAMLAEDGFDVVGVTMQLYDHGAMIAKTRACCAGRDIHDARRISETMGFPHYVLDYESLFRSEVMDEFADSYLAGATPVPCIRCNQRVKFEELLGTAKDLGADCLATGHYIRRTEGPFGAELHRAADPDRDQSYFLFATTQDQLEYLRFPLGGVAAKSVTRDLARKFGLAVAEKPDSQDICFVPEGNYADVIKKLRPGAAEPGNIVDLDGNAVGSHDGVIHFTVGQRRGLGIGGLKDPLYVVRLDPDRREVVVGPKSELESARILVGEVNWLGDGPFDSKPIWEAEVKIRSTRPSRAAAVRPLPDGFAEVELFAPETAVSPGQACVFYAQDSTRVLGGGWIKEGRYRP